MVNVWSNPWIPLNLPRAPRAKEINCEDYKVKDWILDSGQGWDETKIRNLVDKADVNTILSIKLCP